MGSLRRFSRWLLIAVAAVVASILIAAVVGLLWLHSSLPQTQGRLIIAGLLQPVTVDRDNDGIPHIQAQSEHDAYLALGFIHAQDRLWQMETTRRVGAGRLAEMAGLPLLATDKFMRSLGLYARAEEIFQRAPPDVRAALIAYADGVNAFLASSGGAWPPEFYLVGVRPEPWRPADSLVWGQLMGLRLAGDWRNELTRLALSARLTPEQITQLLDDPADGPVTIEQLPRKAASATPVPALPAAVSLDPHMIDQLARLLPPWLGPNSASNSWVLSGERTTTGKPLLANDPHLALEIPNTWYLVRITAPGLAIAGATAPGVPFHVLGHNDRIAWGFTNTGSDVQDLFVEKTDPDDPTRYLAPGGPLPFITRQETIKVKNAGDVVITVRETRHGPVISDLTDGPQPGVQAGEVLAFASTGLRPDDQSAEALYRMNRAGDWAQFTGALRHFHYPQQNITYADVDGNIGFYVAGRVPIRKAGDGALPVPGWTGSNDWTGLIPFEELPHSFNPPSGRLINANNRVVGADYLYPLGREWAPPFRARRIEALVDRVTRHPVPDMARMQGDVRDLAARDLLPLMLPAVQALPAPTPMAREAITLLEDWTALVKDDLPQPLIFNAWLRELNRAIYADELGEDFPRLSGILRPRFITRVLTEAPQWCDDVNTPIKETCETQLQIAFTAALEFLASEYGPVPQRWRWGEAHRVRFSHRVLSRVPLLGRLTDVELTTPGDDSTVNRGTTNIRDDTAPFEHIHGPSLRAIYDLADLASSRFILAGGQSGNRLSPLYSNMAERWRDVSYVTIPVKTRGAHRLLLTPGAGR
jgi:penicillin amidase